MKILLIGPVRSTFVRNDILALSKRHRVETLDSLEIGRGARAIFGMTIVSLRSLWKMTRCDLFVSWFADYYALFPILAAKTLGKKSVVIAGGFDVDAIPSRPDLRYGARARAFRRFCVKTSFELADVVLPVSQFAEKMLMELAPNCRRKEVIYNGVDLARFERARLDAPRDIVLTVSQASDWVEYVRKGSDAFIRLAKSMPSAKFVLAGLRGKALERAKRESEGVANCEILAGPLSLYDELIPLYERASAYCQFSLSETFGVAVVEAMLCGALPIVFPNGALPEIVGAMGKMVGSLEDAKPVVSESFSLSLSQRRALADYAKRFSLEKREAALQRVIASLKP